MSGAPPGAYGGGSQYPPGPAHAQQPQYSSGPRPFGGGPQPSGAYPPPVGGGYGVRTVRAPLHSLPWSIGSCPRTSDTPLRSRESWICSRVPTLFAWQFAVPLLLPMASPPPPGNLLKVYLHCRSRGGSCQQRTTQRKPPPRFLPVKLRGEMRLWLMSRCSPLWLVSIIATGLIALTDSLARCRDRLLRAAAAAAVASSGGTMRMTRTRMAGTTSSDRTAGRILTGRRPRAGRRRSCGCWCPPNAWAPSSARAARW